MSYNKSAFNSNETATVSNPESYLKTEGIINNDEQFETIYLAEDEIEKFMEKYLLENPDTEIETRYLNQPPVEVVQDIEVRWLRPETPEIPPIIIKEIVDNTPHRVEPTIRIVQTRKDEPNEKPLEPTIIREKPPLIPIPEPTFAYVQNVIKRQVAPPKSNLPEGKEIKIEHIRSESQNSFSNKGSVISENFRNLNNHQPNFSFEEHHSIIEDEEEEYGINRNKSTNSIDEQYRLRNRVAPENIDEDHQLRLYEEKLKQTLYEEYLLRLEREKLEKKLTESGLFDQRIRERSNSHDRCSSLYSNARYSEHYLNNVDYLIKERKNDLKEQQKLREHSIFLENRSRPKNNNNRLNESFESSSDTSTYKNIKFSKVIDQNDLKRLNEILTNPNSPSITSKTEGDRIMSSFEDVNEMNTQKPESSNKNQHSVKFQQKQNNNYQNTSTENFSNIPKNLKSFSGFNNNFRLPRTESEKKFLDDLKAYEMYNNGLKSRLSENGSFIRPIDLSRSGSGSGGFRRHKVTSVNRYYSSNNPNPITDTTTDITSYKY